jgi:hypothetical protein
MLLDRIRPSALSALSSRHKYPLPSTCTVRKMWKSPLLYSWYPRNYLRFSADGIQKTKGGCKSMFSWKFKGTHSPTQAWNFFGNFFAETETLWSQGPLTRDFWKSYSIRPRYSTFSHFRLCSACDEIGSAYAQPAMKFVPCMLSVRWNSFRVCSAWIYM